MRSMYRIYAVQNLACYLTAPDRLVGGYKTMRRLKQEAAKLYNANPCAVGNCVIVCAGADPRSEEARVYGRAFSVWDDDGRMCYKDADGWHNFD